MSDEEEQRPGEQSSRVAGGCVLVVLAAAAVLALWGIVRAAPYVAYVIVGVLGCLSWQKARGWFARRRANHEAEDADEETGPDVAEALRSLVGDDRGVLLTTLRDELGAADTKAVKALLEEAGVPWRAGVRTAAGNGPGVHRDDIPAPLSPVDGTPVGRCLCRSEANANANNAPTDPAEEGFRVVPIGQAGTVIYDPADVSRHHEVSGK